MDFLFTAFNGFDIMACDIGNTYQNAPNIEKVNVMISLEIFVKEHEGKIERIVRAVYGMKSAGVFWRAMFVNELLYELVYHSCPVDPDV